ncbi:hypothetical protein Ddye_024690 [Dipteronia dyeriana]|uniref:Male-enhanced antigen 1 n=1 Tax=Dipteronia dyeriana TaxID=168575 RepID=A0AAD9TVU6_9ROSI|nr:hypothetical protein Ddye_024690 [Dipteronia dyeriana]
MNAASTDFNQEINGGSDSDTSLDDTPEYYQPISAVDQNDEDSDLDVANSDVGDSDGHNLPNGYHVVEEAEDRMSSMHINDDVSEEKSGTSSEDEVEEHDESAVTRAFREDENRRNAPLTPENATRVMDAMRGVSFSGSAPDWINMIPEDRWMDQLRRIRQPPPTSSSTNVQN